MRSYSVRGALALTAIVAAPAFDARAAFISSNPFVGVTFYEHVETSPRTNRIYVAEIDMTAPGISFVTTPSNGASSGEVVAQTTPAFVQQQGAQIGINGDFFTGGTSARSVVHLAMSKGQQVSPWGAGGGGAAMNITADHIASVVRPASGAADYNTNPAVPLYNTIGGNEHTISNGVVIATDTTVHPRTAIGYKGSKLYLLTVDGRQGSYSGGMSTVEVAHFLKNNYGVTDAINLDGGGSTTMVLDKPGDGQGPLVMNSPSDGSPRVNGNNFAVFATPIGEPPPPKIITPNVNAPSSGAGLSSPFRNVARVVQQFVDSSHLGAITEQTKLTGLSFRLRPEMSTLYSNLTFPTVDVSFGQYEIVLGKASAAASAANTLTSDVFANNVIDPVVVRSGALTVPKGAFTDNDTGPGAAGSAEFSFFVNFTTDYVINPGEDLVVFIRHAGFSGTQNAFNFETYTHAGAVRVSTAGYSATAGNSPASNNDALKLAFRGTVVPEPTGVIMLGIAGFGALGLRSRRSRA